MAEGAGVEPAGRFSPAYLTSNEAPHHSDPLHGTQPAYATTAGEVAFSAGIEPATCSLGRAGRATRTRTVASPAGLEPATSSSGGKRSTSELQGRAPTPFVATWGVAPMERVELPPFRFVAGCSIH